MTTASLRPHLAQSYEQTRERDRLRRRVGTLAGALEDTGTHVIDLDPSPSEVTPGALVLLYRHFGRPGTRALYPPAVEPELAAEAGPANIPAGMRRRSPPALPELSQPEVLRLSMGICSEAPLF